MSKFQKIIFGGFLFVIAVLVYMEATKPVPLNWYSSYVESGTVPLASKVFYTLLDDKLEDRLKKVSNSPFENLNDSTFNGTYFFLNNEIAFDKAEMERLLNWVGRGNQLFISANYIGSVLKDTLKLQTQTIWLSDKTTTEPALNLSNSTLKLQNPAHIARNFSIPYFEEIDTLSQVVLGVGSAFNASTFEKPKANFITQDWGKGNILIHLQPEVFSNYFLLEKEENLAYTEGVLSYIDTKNTLYWDAHYKSGNPINTSPLHLLLANKYFKWAYYLLLIAVVLFVLFEGKRKQRSIPILVPNTNRSFEYARTISGMYFDKKQYKEIAKKQVSLFMEYVRTRLRVNTTIVAANFVNEVAARSGNTLEDTKKLLKQLSVIEKREIVTEEQLKLLYTNISEFKKHTDGTY
jgi:hypothetical protein